MDNATLLSIIAIAVSGLTLIWNILWSLHREFSTPKFKVTFYVGAIYNVNGQLFFAAEGDIVDDSLKVTKTSDWKIKIIITNFGRQSLKMRELYAIRRGIYKVFSPKEMRIDSGLKLPINIEYGDEINIELPFNESCFLEHKFFKLGVIDNYGKSHWASRKDMKKARKHWIREFVT